MPATSPGYRLFVFLLDHWVKVLGGWSAAILVAGTAWDKPSWIAWGVAIPIGFLALFAAVIIVFAMLSHLIGRLLR